MAIGATVRRMFGRHERLVSELWRRIFVDLDHFVEHLRIWTPRPHAILEIGCGEGAGTERLAAAYPEASILAIDIAPNLGRLYAGNSERVMFRQVAVTELASTHPAKFDLILMCDVLHHVPEDLRAEIIAAARTMLAPGGSFIFKDWAPTATIVHWIAYAADRWLTGDRIRFATISDAEVLLERSFGSSCVQARSSIKPWPNNFALLIKATA